VEVDGLVVEPDDVSDDVVVEVVAALDALEVLEPLDDLLSVL
jgi:hypothetical protein